MTNDHNAPVVSGRPYLIVEVSDRAPRALNDFLGDIAFVAVDDERTQRISGIGSLESDGVRFCQKDDVGHDLRSWLISEIADEQFEAYPLSIF